MSIDPVSLAITVALTAAQMGLAASRKIEGPRLNDTKFNDGDYGASIPRIWGQRWINPPIFWAEDLKEVKRRRKTKGGKYNEYTYFGTWAAVLACHPISGIGQIKFDNKLVFDLTGAGPVTPFDFGDRGIAKDADGPMGIGIGGINYGNAVALYLGTEDQEPDPRIMAWTEAKWGEGSCPGYRGMAYIVFKDIPLDKFGNRIPQTSVLEYGTQSAHYPVEIKPISVSFQDAFFSPSYGTFVAISGSNYQIWDTAARGVMITGTATVSLNVSPGFGSNADGNFRGVSSDNKRLFIASPDGVAWTEELYFGATYHTDQESVFTVLDGHQTDHWGTIPWSSNDTFFFDGFAYTMADLTGASWRPTHYFTDAYGDVWAVGMSSASGSTTAYFRRMFAIGASPIAMDFFAAPGLTTSSPLGSVYACHYADDTHDQFVFSWLGTKTYIFDIATAATTDTGAAGLGSRAALIYANLPAGSRTIWYADTGTTFYEYSLADFSLVRSPSLSSWVTSDSIAYAVYDPITHALVVRLDGGSNLAWCYLDRVASDDVMLKDIVEDVCLLAGMDAGDFDASALTETIPGFSVTQGSGKDWLEPICDLYDVDPRPHGFSLEFVKRGALPAGALSYEDFAMPEGSGANSDGGNIYSLTRSGGTDVPPLMQLTFADVNAGQEKNMAMSGPLAGNDGTRITTIDMSTLALDGDTARQLLARYHRRIRMDRVPYSFALPNRAPSLEPADVYTVELREVTESMRIAKIELGADGRINTEWRRDDRSIALLDGATGASFDGYVTPTIAVPLISKGFALDIPLLSDANNDNNPLIYVAAGPYAAGTWPGAVIYRETGGEYSDEFAGIDSTGAASWGYVTDALGDANPWLWDRGNSVNIKLQSGTLTGCTEADIDADPMLNLCLIGAELVNFTTATLETDGSYTLSGFKRGRRGTEWAAGDHTASDVFLLLDTAQGIETGLSDVGTDLSFKAVTNGRTATGAFPITVAPLTGVSLKPYAPCHLTAVQSGSDWDLAWVRRTRVGGTWTSGTSIPLSEASEAYELEILSGSTVVRTVTGLTSPSYTYSSADQTTDFGAPLSSAPSWRVYQISDAVGRGFAATA